MARQGNVFAWNRSSSADVVGYRLRITKAPEAPTRDTPPVELGDVDQVDLATLEEARGLDGTYNLAVAPVDDSGLEGDLTPLADQVIDLVPPEPATNFRRL